MTVNAEEQAIRDLIDTWMKASRDGDTATVLSLMTDDVVFMVPGHEPFGKAAFAVAAESMKNVTIDGRASIVELEVLGDVAYLRNHIDMSMTPADGAPVHRSGYTLTILRKQRDGRWLLARDANLVS
jgi:uncharacterized protein (TIGR02246 family)